MSVGYIYCFSNESMPGILKIGMTERTPEERLKEANNPDTWRPPTLYKIEIAKKVTNPLEKEKAIHNILDKFKVRINPKREFFRITIEDIKMFFNLMDGEIWDEKVKPGVISIPPPVIEESLLSGGTLNALAIAVGKISCRSTHPSAVMSPPRKTLLPNIPPALPALPEIPKPIQSTTGSKAKSKGKV